ncbi:DNA-directed DNA polymerase [Synergistales bacterium]|nr:DNA-directed DNA polymerase [Synergistales bacterium]
MTDKPFVHLHIHSEYSLLDGANRCSELAAAASEMGMGAVALTDHGVMYGCVEFYDACKKHSVKAILGCEVYVAPNGHTNKESKERNHLVLLAENDEGYRNLTRLVSIGCTDGFYHKPRVDHDLIARYSKGLIAMSACLAGEIPSLIASGDTRGALSRAEFYRDMMGKDNFFLEVQGNSIPRQAIVNKGLVEISRKHGFPLVATNDAHYMKKEDAKWHDILLCVQTKRTVNDEKRFRFQGDDYYFKTREEMWETFGGELPDSLTNTALIAERCSVSMELDSNKYYLPNYDIPEGETLASHLRTKARAGLCERLKGAVSEEYSARLEYELGVIEQMDFPGYFCIVSDIIEHAKNRSIPVGPGRGSAAGSLAAWALRITELDPIKHGLLFERFLNPERISMPDIDTDISDKGRDEVISYIVNKYGADHVSQIITFGHMKGKQAVKDVGRAMAVPYAEVEKIAKLVSDPIKSGIKSIPEAIRKTPDLQAIYESDPQMKKLLDTASKVEGLARHTSQHAAGVVITPKPTTEMVPVTRIDENQVVTQFEMGPLEHLGLVKMDILGLRTLSIIEGALENIKSSGYEPLDLNEIPMDDEKTFEMLRTADTLGVFQLESGGMRNLIKRLKPDRFGDLVALVALYRPGPLESGMADQYVKRKHKEERVEFPHPLLADALEESYGVILYQEQVMQCAVKLSGYTLGEADLLRRAMGKKKADVMAKEREKFVSGAEKNGVQAAKAGEIFDIIEKFAGYGFNKSHSAAYALIAYQTAYLKAHYGAEYFASYLSALVGERMESLGRYIGEVRELGFRIAAPDINRSRYSFTVADGTILFGLSAVAKVGSSALASILGEREESGPFNSLWDFLSRIDLGRVNKGVLENLIKSGAFASVEKNKHAMLDALPSMMDFASRKGASANQRDLFDGSGETFLPEMPNVPEYEQRKLLEFEKESMGICISGHPYDEYKPDGYKYADCALSDLAYWKHSTAKPSVLAIVDSFKERYTKSGDAMGILTIEDDCEQMEAVCFPRQWADVKPIIRPGAAYILTGTVRNEDDRGLSLLVDKAESLEDARESGENAVRIRVSSDGLPDDFYGKLIGVLKNCPGKAPVLIDLRTQDTQALLRMKSLKVSMAGSIAEEIKELSKGMASVIF